MKSILQLSRVALSSMSRLEGEITLQLSRVFLIASAPPNLPPMHAPPSNLRHPLVTLRAFGAQFGPDFQEKGKSIYMENPPALRKSTAKNLERSVRDLNLITGTQLTFSSADLVTSMKANLVISDE